MNDSILVIGGGIAGRAVARALALHGVPSTLVEQRPRSDALGMGLNLPGNAVLALEQLGVAAQVTARGEPVRRREYRNGRGRLLFAVDETRFWGRVGTPVCVRHGHLLEALEPPPPAVEQWGARAIRVRPVAGEVQVQLEGEEASRSYDLVVGADGVHSATRPAVAAHAVRPSTMTASSWRMITANPGVDCWTVWSGPAATFLLVPLGEGQVYGYAASTRGGSTGDDQRWLARAFAGFPRPVTEVVDTVLAGGGELHHAPVHEVRLPTWHSGRLVLVGDAAHATGPVWAQGAALALEDALTLARLLTQTGDRDDTGTAFERLRRPRADHVQAATDRMSRLARWPGPVRDAVAAWLGPAAYRHAYAALRVPAGH